FFVIHLVRQLEQAVLIKARRHAIKKQNSLSASRRHPKRKRLTSKLNIATIRRLRSFPTTRRFCPIHCNLMNTLCSCPLRDNSRLAKNQQTINRDHSPCNILKIARIPSTTLVASSGESTQ